MRRDLRRRIIPRTRSGPPTGHWPSVGDHASLGAPSPALPAAASTEATIVGVTRCDRTSRASGGEILPDGCDIRGDVPARPTGGVPDDQVILRTVVCARPVPDAAAGVPGS